MHEPTAEDWTKLLAEYERSELSQKEFAAQHDLSLAKFQYQLYKRTKGKTKPAAGRSSRFLPVQVVASPGSKAQQPAEVLEAILLSGVVVRFTSGTDTRYLAELFAAIG